MKQNDLSPEKFYEDTLRQFFEKYTSIDSAKDIFEFLESCKGSKKEFYRNANQLYDNDLKISRFSCAEKNDINILNAILEYANKKGLYYAEQIKKNRDFINDLANQGVTEWIHCWNFPCDPEEFTLSETDITAKYVDIDYIRYKLDNFFQENDLNGDENFKFELIDLICNYFSLLTKNYDDPEEINEFFDELNRNITEIKMAKQKYDKQQPLKKFLSSINLNEYLRKKNIIKDDWKKYLCEEVFAQFPERFKKLNKQNANELI